MSDTETVEAEPCSPQTAEEVVADTIAKLQSGELELPEEMFNPPEAAPELAPEFQEPEHQEAEWYRCKYGHLQEGEYYYETKHPVTKAVIWRSPPVCVRCEAEWRGSKFKTFRCAPPTKPKAQ